jgi:hypothetical protein
MRRGSEDHPIEVYRPIDQRPHQDGAGLGAVSILDGLQITISSSVTGVLTSSETLGMTSTEIGLIASIYLVGEMVGALVFGRTAVASTGAEEVA